MSQKENQTNICILQPLALRIFFNIEYKNESHKIDLHNYLYAEYLNIDTIQKVINQSQLSVLSTSGQISNYLNLLLLFARINISHRSC